MIISVGDTVTADRLVTLVIVKIPVISISSTETILQGGLGMSEVFVQKTSIGIIHRHAKKKRHL